MAKKAGARKPKNKGKTNNKEPNIKFLDKLTTWRNGAQISLFTLLRLITEKQTKIEENKELSEIFQLLTGIAFSFWRAVFLAEFTLETSKATKDAKDFLTKVVRDNSIAYADERQNQRWTAGFYASHIQYRMYHLQQTYGHRLRLKELKDFRNKWNPLTKLPANRNKFFAATIDCLTRLTDRLSELAG
ncbi:MAG TPA: hypothetical protein VGY91_13670 [Chthoniobacterales bacterium]|jgi:hypothetical protein|nr:hypothetical protein [Chthoniobacterales bacterium]